MTKMTVEARIKAIWPTYEEIAQVIGNRHRGYAHQKMSGTRSWTVKDALSIETASGGRIHRSDVLPDMFDRQGNLKT